MKALDVKQGDSIVYAINGQEYNGVALGSPSLGHHPGLKASSFYLNLIYLNEGGTAIRVMGAPLLTSAMSDEDLNEIAKNEAVVNGRFPGLGSPEVEAAKERITASPRTIGWRPTIEGELLKALKASLASAQAQVADQASKLTALQSAKDASDKATAEAQAEVAGLSQHVAELQSHVEQLVAAQTAAPVVEAEPVEDAGKAEGEQQSEAESAAN